MSASATTCGNSASALTNELSHPICGTIVETSASFARIPVTASMGKEIKETRQQWIERRGRVMGKCDKKSRRRRMWKKKRAK